MSQQARLKLCWILCAVAVLVVLWRLSFFGGDDASLNSANVDKRLIAMEQLWHQNDDQARAKLREMTADPDQRVVLQSIRGMGQNRDAANQRHLESFTAPDREPLLRREAIAALGNYPDVPVSQFTSALATERDAQVRAGAAQALARRADKATVPAMYKALSDPDPHVRIWAITGIKNVTHVGFLYDAELSPQEQRTVIQEIGAYLRRNGFL